MWLTRKKSNSTNTTPTSPNRRSNFNRQSFKNIEDLLGDDDKKDSSDQKPKPKPSKSSSPVSKPSSPVSRRSSPVSKPSSPVSPTTTTAAFRLPVFQRVRLANQFTRSINTTRSKPNLNKSHINNAASKHKSPISAPSISNASSMHKSPISAPSIDNLSSIHSSDISIPTVNIPGSEKRIVVYMTSLGAVRPTFDACRAVRSILQGFRVAVDERDLSMDATFKDELQKIMSNESDESIQVNNNTLMGLPRVFIGGRYVGDADDMRELNETGELKKLVERLPAVSRGVCEGCGDFRFVICSDCNGSRKCYREKGVFRSCTVCNKNGLIRCPTCWTNVKC